MSPAGGKKKKRGRPAQTCLEEKKGSFGRSRKKGGKQAAELERNREKRKVRSAIERGTSSSLTSTRRKEKKKKFLQKGKKGGESARRAAGKPTCERSERKGRKKGALSNTEVRERKWILKTAEVGEGGGCSNTGRKGKELDDREKGGGTQ